MMQIPSVLCQQVVVDPTKLIQEIFLSAWVRDVFRVEMRVEYDTATAVAHVHALTYGGYGFAFVDLFGFEPSLSATRRDKPDGARGVVFRGEYSMAEEAFAEFVALGSRRRTPEHISTLFNGRQLDSYSPRDVVRLQELVSAATFSCERCGILCPKGAPVLRDGGVWCSDRCAEAST